MKVAENNIYFLKRNIKIFDILDFFNIVTNQLSRQLSAFFSIFIKE
jgi:hypothetical protein